MGRKRNPEKSAKPPLIQETELVFLEALGPSFKAGVEKVRGMTAGIETAKQAYKDAKKAQRKTFRTLRKLARGLAEAGL